MKKTLTLTHLTLALALLLGVALSLNGCKKDLPTEEKPEPVLTAAPTPPPTATKAPEQEKKPERPAAAGQPVTETDLASDERPAPAATTPSDHRAALEGSARTIYFDFDRSELKAEARGVLKGIAEAMNGNDLSVRIEGHCDERGTSEYNMALGERRAQAAKRYLIQLGVPGSRLSTISYGEEKPADSGHNEGAWSRNRRDEFTVR